MEASTDRSLEGVTPYYLKDTGQHQVRLKNLQNYAASCFVYFVQEVDCGTSGPSLVLTGFGFLD
jgi:hypothetical protein